MLRIITLNLNGIRAAAGKGFFPWLARQDADIVCLQELKAQPGDLTQEMLGPPGNRPEELALSASATTPRSASTMSCAYRKPRI